MVVLVVGTLFLQSAGRDLGQGIGQAMGVITQGAAAKASFADGVAKAHHIPDGGLTLAVLNQQRPDVRWLAGDRSAPLSGNDPYVSISVAGDYVITVADFASCTFGLTVSAKNDPIISQDHLPGVGTYYVFPNPSPSLTPTCSANAAPTTGWTTADTAVIRQINASSSG
ncbi:MAG TPA: hypothetical protein VK277_12030 [Acidimicrobiales bacterium]|nr:hypothetical protein [Acidimicrobiales bacterium]